MRCLDLGCGGGDVSLLMAELVGEHGAVVGTDIDPVKIDLARHDARARRLHHVEFRVESASELDEGDAYDLAYARLLLTHVHDPADVLRRMVTSTKPGGAVVVEDLDHSSVFAHPRCSALEQYVDIFNQAVRARGGDPEIGPKLVSMFDDVGLTDLELSIVQPAFFNGPAKRIHQITLENVAESVSASGLATLDELATLADELEHFAADPTSIISFPRIFQVIGRRRATR
jgi:SAM-dependent methyltransferase